MPVFKMPVPTTIMGRSSSITNSFVSGIIPCIEPTDAEIDAALDVLGMNRETIRCAYCGKEHTEWDHLNPLIVNKAPTGYISEIHNLVPACGKCNQSKGNSNWREWITGNAKLSPKSRGVEDLESKIDRLLEYEEKFAPVKIDLEGLIGNESWLAHWANYEKVIEAMRQAQVFSDAIKVELLAKLNRLDGKVCDAKKRTTRKQVPMQTKKYDVFSSNSESEKILDKAGISMDEGESFQNYIKRSFRYLMESNLISDKEIENLADKAYCKRTFKLNDRFLFRKRWFDAYNHPRSWKDPICGYYLCKEWNRSRFDELVPRYKQWVARMIRLGRTANSA